MHTRIPRLRRVGLAALATLTAVVGLVPLAQDAHGVSGFTWRRFSGANRFDTARLVAVEFGQASTVLLARGDLFPDALAGSYLAGSTGQGAPILLTRTDSLPPETDQALSALGTTRVILLGGFNAIGSGVENQLRAKNIQTDRIAGATRFDTAQQIAERQGPGNVGQVDGLPTAMVASGRNFPDALAGSPVSYSSKLPILLTEPGFLSSQARSGMSNLGVKQVLLLGGEAAVSRETEEQIKSLGITVQRIQGANRAATAVAIAEYANSKLGFSRAHVNLARGDSFADALVGGPHGGKDKAALLLATTPNVLGNEARDYLVRNSGSLTAGHIFGGENAITTQVENEARAAAQSGRANISVTPSNVPQGGEVKGNASGDGITSVTVTGCGFSDQAVPRDSSGNFSVPLPAATQPGPCTLVFTTKFGDNTTEVDEVPVTIQAPPRVETAAPELLRAVYVRTVKESDPGAPGTTYDVSTIRFTFDEPVSGSSPGPANAARFLLYDYRDTRAPFKGQSAQLDPADLSSVLVKFGERPCELGNNFCGRRGPLTQADVANLTTAAVLGRGRATDENPDDATAPAAVTNNRGIENFEGDSGLSVVTFGAGQTAAPDLLTVSNFRPNFDNSRTLIDFTFDQIAWPVRPTDSDINGRNQPTESNRANGYQLVLNDPDASVRTCEFKNPDSPNSGTGVGTKVHTVECGAIGTSIVTAAQVARGYVMPGIVSDRAQVHAQQPPIGDPNFPMVADAPEGVLNPLTAADVTGNGDTSTPDLVKITIKEDAIVNGVPADQATFTFDEPVLLGNQPEYRVYLTSGREVQNIVVLNGSGTPPQRSSTNPNEVIATFDDNALTEATGGSVDPNAVMEAVSTGGVNRANRADEVSIRPFTFAADRTTAPDLVGCGTDVAERDPFTNEPKAYRLVFTFDERIRSVTGVPERFHLYSNTGREIPSDQPDSRTVTRGTLNTEVNKVYVTGYSTEAIRQAAACGIAQGVVFDTPFTGAQDPSMPNPAGGEIFIQA